ncbi:PPOX class F420-dependent oxidoreductase [Amycolatopsis balhimycina DSM 5908]|uniref:PPOX class F420-dependent oxidoreductase n=1 Tax=Amycolatopsis balhimycina DSM 5908 TaxID=1081091 RepID=A0A428WF18_AMYBA|nr:PPOX class F420-dependent oxidoreductase [Amycolatopsis balhimycina DSM 5908]
MGLPSLRRCHERLVHLVGRQERVVHVDGRVASVVWVGLDDGELVFSATEDRRKVRNLRRDPRISVSITDAENPYRHTQLRGTVTITPDPGKALPKTLSHKYLAQDPPPEGDDVQRVVVRLKAGKIAGNVK